ncbi:hypothetical protein BST61_g8702 [Cercospora zeina]
MPRFNLPIIHPTSLRLSAAFPGGTGGKLTLARGHLQTPKAELKPSFDAVQPHCMPNQLPPSRLRSTTCRSTSQHGSVMADSGFQLLSLRMSRPYAIHTCLHNASLAYCGHACLQDFLTDLVLLLARENNGL